MQICSDLRRDIFYSPFTSSTSKARRSETISLKGLMAATTPPLRRMILFPSTNLAYILKFSLVVAAYHHVIMSRVIDISSTFKQKHVFNIEHVAWLLTAQKHVCHGKLFFHGREFVLCCARESFVVQEVDLS